MNDSRKAKRNKLLWLATAIVAPALEVALLIFVSGVVGIWTTVLLVLLSSALGLYLWIRWFRRLIDDHEKLKEEFGESLVGLPGEVVLVSTTEFAGSLIAFFCFLAPGFISDTIGFILTVPAIRDGYRKRVEAECHRLAAAEGLTLEEYLLKKNQSERRP